MEDLFKAYHTAHLITQKSVYLCNGDLDLSTLANPLQLCFIFLTDYYYGNAVNFQDWRDVNQHTIQMPIRELFPVSLPPGHVCDRKLSQCSNAIRPSWTYGEFRPSFRRPKCDKLNIISFDWYRMSGVDFVSGVVCMNMDTRLLMHRYLLKFSGLCFCIRVHRTLRHSIGLSGYHYPDVFHE